MPADTVYEILDNLPATHYISPPPAQLWLLLTLEIVVRDDHGNGLLLIYPSYSLPSQEKDTSMAEGHWAPPFLAYPISMAYVSPNTVGTIKELFQDFEKTIQAEKEIFHLAYLLGLPDPQIRPAGSFIELKKSPRMPEMIKCYKIIRFACLGMGNLGLKNISDPECRKGHVFLPLDDLKKSSWSYISKPLMTNVRHILSQQGAVEGMKAHAIKLASNEFVVNEKGILVCIDLSGYGTASKYAMEQMHTFSKNGSKIAEEFRDSVAVLFYKLLVRIGVSQVHMAGDGLICAIPVRHFINGSSEKTYKNLMLHYMSLLKEIGKLNKFIKNSDKKLGSRIALHFGSYRYGRIAGIRSFSSDFEGSNIIEVARLEVALREYVKGPVSHSVKSAASQSFNDKPRHSMICSKEFCDAIGDPSQGTRVLFISDIKVGIKEYHRNAKVYQL